MRTVLCRLTAVVLLAIAATSHAPAEDLVVLTSGNRMTGTVRHLTRGQLNFSIDGVGRVDIDWHNVETLRSVQRLDIELASGERLTGSIAATPPGKIEVTGATGGATGPKMIDLNDVVRINPIEATFRERTTGSVDLGLDLLAANDEIDWTFNIAAENRTKNYLTEASLSSLVRRHNDETAQQRNRFEIGSRRFLANRWFALGLFEAEEDRELDLDLRVLVGAAMGRTLIQSNRTLFAVYGGLDIAHEEFRGVSQSDDEVVEALAAVEWDWFELGSDGDTALLMKATTYVAPDDGRVRFNLDGSLRHDIASDYYLSLNVYESYNSDPPAGLEKSDLGVAITFGRSF